jgi:RNA polymerase sigma-70 factor, ECF subfamily
MCTPKDILSRDSMAELYRLYAGELMAFANSILRNPDDSQEVVQELFCTLYEKLPDKEIWNSTVRAFLFVSVKNRSLNFMARNKRIVRLADDHAKIDNQYDAINDRLTGDAVCEYVRTSVSSLQWELFNLRIIHGLTWREISEITEIPLSSAHREYETLISVIKRKFPDVF